MTWKEKLYENYISSGITGEVIDDLNSFYARFKPSADRIAKYLPVDRNIQLLDLGCGSGKYLYHFREKGYQLIEGVDSSREQVELAHKFGVNDVVHGDIFAFLNSKVDSSIDVIMLIDVLEHLTREELFDLLNIINTKLKKHGKVIVHIPNAEGIFGNRVRYGDLTHELAFTQSSVNQMFRSNGFGRVKCFEDKPLIFSITSLIRRIIWDIGTIPFRLLFAAETGDFSPVLSQNMLVVAER